MPYDYFWTVLRQSIIIINLICVFMSKFQWPHVDNLLTKQIANINTLSTNTSEQLCESINCEDLQEAGKERELKGGRKRRWRWIESERLSWGSSSHANKRPTRRRTTTTRRRRRGGSPSSPQGSYSVDSVNFNSESVKVIIDQGGNIWRKCPFARRTCATRLNKSVQLWSGMVKHLEASEWGAKICVQPPNPSWQPLRFTDLPHTPLATLPTLDTFSKSGWNLVFCCQQLLARQVVVSNKSRPCLAAFLTGVANVGDSSGGLGMLSAPPF